MVAFVEWEAMSIICILCSTLPMLVGTDSCGESVPGGGVDWRGVSSAVWSCGDHSESTEHHLTHSCPAPLQVGTPW